MIWKKEWKPLAAVTAVFLICFYLPVGKERFDNALFEALYLVKWYAQEHVLLCLIPAFFIAGAIGVFVLAGTSTELVQKYLNWTEKSKGTHILKKTCGILVIAAGLYMVYTA